MSDSKQTYHRLKLKARRKLRKQKKQVEDVAVQADNSLEKLVFRRIAHLVDVKRFVSVWTILMLLIGLGAAWQVRSLDDYYLELKPADGGIYREGLHGSFTTASPLFAVTAADVSVSKLVFSGLFQLAPDGTLDPDIARGYEVDEKGLVYTVTLRNDVKWHDGEPLTSKDIVFTYNRIKSPDSKSPLFSSWRDVSVKAADDHTVIFTLPNALASFHYSLTNGIVPAHILQDVDVADLRSSLFNTESAVGTGPFTFKSVEVTGNDIDDRQEKITLETNENYYKPRAKIDGVVIRTYRDVEALLKAFRNQEITAMTGLRSVSEELSADATVQTFSTPMASSVMIFMNNSDNVLKDKKVRKALIYATDTDELRKSLGYQLLKVDSPFLRSHFAYDESKVQLSFNPTLASRLLDEAGWRKRENGKREKDGEGLKLRLVSQSLSEYSIIVQGIQEQWAKLGIDVDAVLQPEEDIQSGAVSRHDYDILLYGTAIGPDPDVFAYWHSSQADERLRSRLNLSEYKSDAADAALEAGRTRSDEDLRKIKYAPFLKSWVEDVPAIGLYQPRFLFVARGALEGYQSGQFNSSSDRYYSITQWQVRLEKTVK